MIDTDAEKIDKIDELYLAKDLITEEQQVSDEVRKEQIEVDTGHGLGWSQLPARPSAAPATHLLGRWL